MEQSMNYEPQIEQLTIVNIIPTGTGFGVTREGTSVFVPPRVVQAASAEIGDVFSASLVPNDYNPSGRTPFMAVRLERDAQQPVQLGQPDHKPQKQIILDFLQGGPASSAEIGEELGTDAIGASGILKSMWEKGEVAKASVYARADQKRATYVLWALTADDFIEVDNG
jgi:hypothetical protein